MLQTSWQISLFRGMLLNVDLGGFAIFWVRLPGKGVQLFSGGCDLHRNYGMVIILLSFLCNGDNLKVKMNHEKRSYPDERWLFIGRFKFGSVLWISVALVVPKKVSNSVMSWVWCKASNKVIIVINNCYCLSYL